MNTERRMTDSGRAHWNETYLILCFHNFAQKCKTEIHFHYSSTGRPPQPGKSIQKCCFQLAAQDQLLGGSGALELFCITFPVLICTTRRIRAIFQNLYLSLAYMTKCPMDKLYE